MFEIHRYFQVDMTFSFIETHKMNQNKEKHCHQKQSTVVTESPCAPPSRGECPGQPQTPKGRCP